MNKKILYFIFGLVCLIITNLLVDSSDLFTLMLIFSMYLVFINTFSNIKYKNKTSDLLSFSIILIIVISAFYSFISYFLSSLFFKDLRYVFLLSNITIFVYPSIKLIRQYLDNNNKNKKSFLCKLIYNTINLISFIIILVLYKFTNISFNNLIVSLFLQQFISLIIIFIINYKIFVFKKINLNKLRPIFLTDIRKSLISLSLFVFYYISIIFLYFSLTNRYLYDYPIMATLLADVYFYYYYFIVFFSIFYYPKKIDDDINITYIKLVDKLLPISILISILSSPILYIIFNSVTNAYIFALLIFEPLFLIMYVIAMRFLVDKKNFNIILIIGILVKLITTIPLINSLYRMGYSVVYGDIISTMLSLFIPIIITIIYFNNIHKLNFSSYFNKIITIIYENLILCIILILLQLLISLKVDNIIMAFGVIFIYIIVFIGYSVIKCRVRWFK